MDYFINAIIAILFCIIVFFAKSYFSKKGENSAKKEDSREISCEREKGKNLATKYDIAEITEPAA